MSGGVNSRTMKGTVMNRCRFASSPGLLLAFAFAIVMLIGPPAAKADPPTPSEADTAAARALLKENLEWVRSKPDRGSVNEIEIHIASNETARHFVSFTTAKLRLEVKDEGPKRDHHREKTLVGYGTTYFSDRTWQAPSSKEENPFDPSKRDRVGLAVDIESATLLMTLKSWGDGEEVIPLFASNGMLYGYDGSAMLVIDLKQVKVAR
jgi:hypothetical protein